MDPITRKITQEEIDADPAMKAAGFEAGDEIPADDINDSIGGDDDDFMSDGDGVD